MANPSDKRSTRPELDDGPGEAARLNREEWGRRDVLSLALIGPPGAGKSLLIEETCRQLCPHYRLAVVVANPAAFRDSARIRRHCAQVAAVCTSVPTAAHVRQALGKIENPVYDLLLIESMGGISAAPDFGQEATVAVLAVSGGDDKAVEYAGLVNNAELVLLTKSDLRGHVHFDAAVFHADIESIHPSLPVLEVSAFAQSGLEKWIEWIDNRLGQRVVAPPLASEPAHPPAEKLFLG